jgi:hypothetical protein
MLQLQVTIMLLVNLAARVFLLILALKVINQMQYPIISIIPPPLVQVLSFGFVS